MRKLIVLIINISLVSLLVLQLSGCSRFPNEINSPEDVEGRVIGGLAGTPSIRIADDLGMAISFDSSDEMMTALRGGMIDCAIMERTTAEELVSDTSGVRILQENLLEYELRFAVPMENRGLLNAVNKALDELDRDGTLRGIANKYFSRRNYTYIPPDETEREGGYLTIALPSDSPPFSFKDDEGRLIGMDIEVAIAVSDFLGVELRVLEYDAWELVNAVWHGRADLALGWHPGEGEGLINTSEPYASAVHVVIVRR